MSSCTDTTTTSSISSVLPSSSNNDNNDDAATKPPHPTTTTIHLLSILRPDWKTATAAHKRFWSWKIDTMGLALTNEDQYREWNWTSRSILPATAPGTPLTTAAATTMTINNNRTHHNNHNNEHSHDHATTMSDKDDEVVFISNCKRLVFVVATTRSPTRIIPMLVQLLEEEVTTWERQTNRTAILPTFQQQQQQSNTTEKDATPANDWTDSGTHHVNHNATREAPSLNNKNNINSDDPLTMATLPSYYDVISGTTDVARYLCRVAVGIPPEARTCVFRPHSSRDAHVLQQLKQAFRAASSTSSLPRLSILMRGCLRVGKHARQYGAAPVPKHTDTDTTATISTATTATTTAITDPDLLAQVVLRDILEPAVVDIAQQIECYDRNDRIRDFRQRAFLYLASETSNNRNDKHANNATLHAMIRQALHAPTMALRQGQDVNETAVLQEIANLVGNAGTAHYHKTPTPGQSDKES